MKKEITNIASSMGKLFEKKIKRKILKVKIFLTNKVKTVDSSLKMNIIDEDTKMKKLDRKYSRIKNTTTPFAGYRGGGFLNKE